MIPFCLFAVLWIGACIMITGDRVVSTKDHADPVDSMVWICLLIGLITSAICWGIKG